MSRESLGMTQAQLSSQLGISRQSVQGFESAEAERRITLDSLDRLARAMGCRMVYALVPEGGSLEGLLERRAAAVADAMLKPADHSMQLEAQGVSPDALARQRKLLTDSLLRGSPRRLWQSASGSELRLPAGCDAARSRRSVGADPLAHHHPRAIE